MARSPSWTALKIRCRSRRTLSSWAGQLMASQPRTASSGPFTCMASNLPFGSGGSGRSSSKAHLPHVSLLSQPGTRPGIRPVIRARPPGGNGHLVPVSCCLSAAGICFLGILCPPGNWAPLTVGLPVPWHRTLTGFPCSARVRCGWGRTSSIPRGRRCPHGRECSTTAACRIATALSLSPRHCIPARRVTLTRHRQGFPGSRPVPSLPLTCGPQSGQGPLGFPMSSAPGRYRPRTSWRGQVQTPTRSHVTGIASLHPTRLTPHVRPHVAGITHASWLLCPITCAPSPCGRPSRPPWQAVTPATTAGTLSP